MQPKLVKIADGIRHDDNPRRKAHEQHWNPKNCVKQIVEEVAAHCRCNVQLFRGMVRNMQGPKKARCMTDAVKPIKKEVINEERKQKIQNRILGKFEWNELINPDIEG